MSQTQLTSLAAFSLRVALGIMFLAHSLILKLLVFTLPGTARFFETIGMPGWFAYVVFPAKVVAGVLLVLGGQTRWGDLATVLILAGATWAHSGNGRMFGYENGGREYPANLTLLAIVQGMPGDRAFALHRSLSPTKIAKFNQKEAMQ